MSSGSTRGIMLSKKIERDDDSKKKSDHALGTEILSPRGAGEPSCDRAVVELIGPQTVMNSVRFSTHEQMKPRQLEAWRNWYEGSFEVTALDAPDRGFAAESEVWKLNGMALVRV